MLVLKKNIQGMLNIFYILSEEGRPPPPSLDKGHVLLKVKFFDALP